MSSRRDSWPPTQVRLVRTGSNKADPRPLLDDIDQDPLTYFLTPAPGDEDDDLDNEFDFDAGIEDTAHPREMIRSVSPSSLEGLRKPGSGAASPDFDSDGITSDEDDNEEYIRFSPPSSNLFLFPNHTLEELGVRSRSPVFSTTGSGFLSPASFPASPPRGRSRFTPRRGLTRTNSSRARYGHLWREPSPDVWSIEEETEEQIQSTKDEDKALEVKQELPRPRPNKPKKKVRFILPARED